MIKHYANGVLIGESFEKEDFSKINVKKTLWLLTLLLMVELIAGIIAAIGGSLAILIITSSENITFQDAISTEIIIISLLISLSVVIYKGFFTGLSIGGLILIPSLILSLVLSQAEISTLIGLAFFSGIGSLSLIFTGLVTITLSATGILSLLKFKPIVIIVNFSIAVLAAKILDGIVAIPTAMIVSALGNYIALSTLR